MSKSNPKPTKAKPRGKALGRAKRKATVRVVKPGAFTAPSVTTTTAGNWSSCWYVPVPPSHKSRPRGKAGR